MAACAVVVLPVYLEDVIREGDRLANARYTCVDTKPSLTVLPGKRPVLRPQLQDRRVRGRPVHGLREQRLEPRPVEGVRVLPPVLEAPAGAHPRGAALRVQADQQVEQPEGRPGAAQHEVQPRDVARAAWRHLRQHVLVQGSSAVQCLGHASLAVAEQQQALRGHPRDLAGLAVRPAQHAVGQLHHNVDVLLAPGVESGPRLLSLRGVEHVVQ
mmetsp:Transcript_99145/g.308480  ORF Transcript_99145/g.308480 Transcript_99145/m.308480 type:complete len:213 (-) Transcript_99145:208-846(-)